MLNEQRLRLYTPHVGQKPVHLSHARFKVVSTGRQFGKSTMGLNEIGAKAWETPNGRFWFISPIYSQAKDQFRRLLKILPEEIITKFSETELRIELIQGAVIEFKSGETFENLRGATLHGIFLDEMREQHPDLWPMIVRPMLTTTRGWAMFASTPHGFNHFYDLAERAKRTQDWEFFTGPSITNPLFTQEEYSSAKESMSEPEFAQEILAEFRDITSDRVYTSYGAHNKQIQNPFAITGEQVSPNLPIWIFCDFNLAPIAWLMAQEHKKHIHVFNEVYIPRTIDQFEAPRLLVSKLMRIPNVQQMQLYITGDATGKATQRTSHKSDYDVLIGFLQSKGFRPHLKTPTVNPGIKDRVTTVNARMLSASGETFVTINPTMAPELDIDLTRTAWKKTETPTLDPGPEGIRTHPSDALGYGICTLAPTEVRGQTGLVRVVRRAF